MTILVKVENADPPTARTRLLVGLETLDGAGQPTGDVQPHSTLKPGLQTVVAVHAGSRLVVAELADQPA